MKRKYNLDREFQIFLNNNNLRGYRLGELRNLMASLKLTAKHINKIGLAGINVLLEVTCLEPIQQMLDETQINLSAIVRGLKRGMNWKQINVFMTYMRNAKNQPLSEPLRLTQKMWPILVRAHDKKREFLLHKLPDILIIVIARKLSLEQIKYFSLKELTNYLEKCLNKTQKQTIEDVILYSIDNIIENSIEDLDNLRRALLATISIEVTGFKETSVYEDVNYVNYIYNHPCPENPAVNANGVNPNHDDLVSYRENVNGVETYGTKPKGLFNLEKFDTNKYRPVNREGVRHFIRKKVGEYIKALDSFEDEYKQFIHEHGAEIKVVINKTNINFFDLKKIGVAGASALIDINNRNMMGKAIMVINRVHISIPQLVALDKDKRDLLIQYAPTMLALHQEAHLSWQEVVDMPAEKMSVLLRYGNKVKAILLAGTCKFETLTTLSIAALHSLLCFVGPTGASTAGFYKDKTQQPPVQAEHARMQCGNK